MSAKGTTRFDRKFGKDFFDRVPTEPGIYRYFDQAGELIYVGKAKNLRRRLAQYRKAKRRKKHGKAKQIVADAARLEFQVCSSELEASILEIQLIQSFKPKWNVEGAFHFLYPMIGLREEGQGRLELCLTTLPESFPGFEFHGAYRSREISGEAFFALVELLTFVAHREKITTKPAPYSYRYGFRGVPSGWVPELRALLQGNSPDFFELLVLALVENAGARAKTRQIQERLDHLKRFWRHEASRLRRMIQRTSYDRYPVPQAERDLLKIRYRWTFKDPSTM